MGNFIYAFGRYGTGAGEFRNPSGLTQDRFGYLYVADYENHRIQIVAQSGKVVSVFGHKGSAAGEFHHSTSAARNEQGSLAVVDKGNGRVQVFHVTIPGKEPVR